MPCDPPSPRASAPRPTRPHLHRRALRDLPVHAMTARTDVDLDALVHGTDETVCGWRFNDESRCTSPAAYRVFAHDCEAGGYGDLCGRCLGRIQAYADLDMIWLRDMHGHSYLPLAPVPL